MSLPWDLLWPEEHHQQVTEPNKNRGKCQWRSEATIYSSTNEWHNNLCPKLQLWISTQTRNRTWAQSEHNRSVWWISMAIGFESTKQLTIFLHLRRDADSSASCFNCCTLRSRKDFIRSQNQGWWVGHTNNKRTIFSFWPQRDSNRDSSGI